jgi:hypothetical protein
MKYALLIIAMPVDKPNDAVADFRNFLQDVGDIGRPSSSVTVLNAGAYLLDLKGGMRELAILLKSAEDRKYTTHVHFFDQKPAFVVTEAFKT